MKLDQKQLVSSATATGLTFAGVAGIYAASKFAPANIGKYVPYAALAGGILLPAFVKGDAVKSLATGMGVYGALATVGQLTKDATGNVATTGIKSMVANYVPQLGSTHLFGETYNYDENSMPLLGTSDYNNWEPAQAEMQYGGEFAGIDEALI